MFDEEEEEEVSEEVKAERVRAGHVAGARVRVRVCACGGDAPLRCIARRGPLLCPRGLRAGCAPLSCQARKAAESGLFHGHEEEAEVSS